MEFCIDLHDSKGHESRIFESTGGEADIIEALRKAIGSAEVYGYCRVTLDVIIPVWTVEEILAREG